MYSSFTPAETYWALNHNETVDFSEVHAAILTSGNGGNFFDADDYFESEELYRSKINHYKEEIAKCTYRQFTTGFFFSAGFIFSKSLSSAIILISLLYLLVS